MITDDLVRTALRAEADRTPPIPDLVAVAVERGQHRRKVRRTALGGTAVVIAVMVVLTGVVISRAGPEVVREPAGQGQSVTTTPWWKSWLPARHNGPIDHALIRGRQHLLAGHGHVQMYAAGTTADGIAYVFFRQTGAGGAELTNMESGGSTFSMVKSRARDSTVPVLTWIAGLPSARYTKSHGRVVAHGKWLIVVGRPGTTRIDYSPDGVHWQPMATKQGIGELYIKNHMVGIPDSSRIRLYDQSGIYVNSASVGRL